jgi:hypothetical protein
MKSWNPGGAEVLFALEISDFDARSQRRGRFQAAAQHWSFGQPELLKEFSDHTLSSITAMP